ncbi:phosphocarrier protein HPr [mine drainage metagenome]|jgi:phosphocarrier protein|uniref:Phosphocarrier protein HPr n=1 Tax=mine drainage metagenome TaxID=410659 RepID=A0A1J5R0G4_9ZZZZ
MLKRELLISNKLGLHARASAKLTKLASEFSSDIWISKGARRVNAKSIMGVMMLAAGIGSRVAVEAEGDDAAQALDAIAQLVDDKFGEGE